MKILVTGANGFLGQHVVRALFRRDPGVQVRALVRSTAKVEDLGWPASVEIFRADLRTSGDLERAFDGVDVLVHLAASVTGEADAQLAAAAGGTERLLDAMAKSACKRVVFASSFSVYDWSRIEGTLDESSPLAEGATLYTRDGYTVAKAWQERVVRRMSDRHGWGLTVLRPGFIWGRDHAELGALGQKMGKLYIAIGPRTRIPMTHVENCADVFALAALDPRADGETFNVVDGEGPRIWNFLGAYLKGVGKKAVRVPMPYYPAYWLVRLAFSTVFQKNTKLPGLLIPTRFESRMKPLRFTNKRVRERLGWDPPLDYHQALAHTFG